MGRLITAASYKVTVFEKGYVEFLRSLAIEEHAARRVSQVSFHKLEVGKVRVTE